MTNRRSDSSRKPISRNKKILGFAMHDIEKIAAFGLVLGYVDVGVIEVGKQEFSFTLRGPVFWRLTAGQPPYLHRPSKGLAADAYLRIEALLAYLLLVGEAHIVQSNTAASTVIWTVSSERFRFSEIGRMLKDNTTSFRYRTAILMLLNVAVGLGMIVRRLPFVVTAVSVTRRLELQFITSAAPFQRTRSRLPSLLTLPRMNAKLYWLGVVVGILLIGQQARIIRLLVERGGLIGFSICAETFRLQVIPGMLHRMIEQADKEAETRET